MNKKQGIGVAVAIFIIGYVFFSDSLMKMFFPRTNNSQNTNMTQTFTAVDTKVGNGPIATSGNELTVHYVGTLSDGQVFDSSRTRGTPFKFTLGGGNVIRGWDEGLVGMRVGGVRKLVISPEYGYGSQAIGPIPPNSTLYFEVELLDAK